MKRLHLTFTPRMLSECGKSVLAVAATTLLLLLAGRNVLGEAVIAMLYLAPIGWSASRWGQGPGLCAAVAAALTFDFLFIPPFYTFAVGRLEGWLVLGIFIVVAVFLVARVQSALVQARVSERDAIFMYELSAALAGLQSQRLVANTVARHLQQAFQARLVQVVVKLGAPPSVIVASAPDGVAAYAKPDRVIPLQAARGLVGEIHVWRGAITLPSPDGRLLRNLAAQAALALERARLAEVRQEFAPAGAK